MHDDEHIQFSSTLEQKDQPIATRVIIEGKVQGVGYRQWLCNRALSASIDGWVRNKSATKTVEAVFVGPERAVLEIIQACYHGPPIAVVSKVKQFPFMDKESVPKGFHSLPTV